MSDRGWAPLNAVWLSKEEAESFKEDRRTQTEARTLRQLDRQTEMIYSEQQVSDSDRTKQMQIVGQRKIAGSDATT